MPVSILNGISTCLRKEILYDRRKKNTVHFGIEEYFILLLMCILILVNMAPVIISVKQKFVL